MQWIYPLRKSHIIKFRLNVKSIFDPSLKRKTVIDLEDSVEESDHPIEKEEKIANVLTSIEKSLNAFHDLP